MLSESAGRPLIPDDDAAMAAAETVAGLEVAGEFYDLYARCILMRRPSFLKRPWLAGTRRSSPTVGEPAPRADQSAVHLLDVGGHGQDLSGDGGSGVAAAVPRWDESSAMRSVWSRISSATGAGSSVAIGPLSRSRSRASAGEP